MKGYALAGRYARALFAIGAESGDDVLDALNNALTALAGAVRQSTELDSLLRSPVITAEEKRGVLNKVLSASVSSASKKGAKGVSAILKNFCALLADRKRLALLGLIAHSFSSMLDARKHVVRGKLCTAIELDPARRETIKSKLEHTINGTLELDYQVDPAILGGLTLRLGDRILDASLRTQLDTLRDTIKKGE